MGLFKRINDDGVSLRGLHFFMILLTGAMTVLLIVATFRIFGTYKALSDATDEYIRMEKDAYAMLEASDYLTECAQRFTLAGDLDYAEAYFNEAFNTRRREQALADMRATRSGQAALVKLEEAMEHSLALMVREYYAMKMIVVAHGYEDYPEPLKAVELNLSEAMLSRGNKITMARNLVLGKGYYNEKEKIRAAFRECLTVLENTTHSMQANTSAKLSSELSWARLVLIWQAVCVLLMILFTTALVIRPMLKAVNCIKADQPLAEIGANEFRYLARAYNHMYEVYRKSVEKLSFRASHDALTRVYNRAGYDLLMANIDLPTTVLLVLDLDDFKAINDHYGHDTGDRALQFLADTIRHNFRADDCICRVGGDEFVVLMSHCESLCKSMIHEKVERINLALSHPGNGLPPMSISVGAAHGSHAETPAQLFELADQALYQTKRNGRRGCTFHVA